MEQPGVGKQRSLQRCAALGSILLLFMAVTKDGWLGEGTEVLPRLAASPPPQKLWAPGAQELDSVCFPSLRSAHAGNPPPAPNAALQFRGPLILPSSFLDLVFPRQPSSDLITA